MEHRPAMISESTQGPLAVVAVAVTPVVLISATAILIGGVSSKHQALADRVRQLMAEYRLPQTGPDRKKTIARQIPLFLLRLRYATLAHLSMYLAAACFIGMVMLISFMPAAESAARLTLPLFVSGVLLLQGAVVLEVLELLLSRKTIEMESDLTGT